MRSTQAQWLPLKNSAISPAITPGGAVGIPGQDSSLWCPEIAECLASLASCLLNANSTTTSLGQPQQPRQRLWVSWFLCTFCPPEMPVGGLDWGESGSWGHENEGPDCPLFARQCPNIFIYTHSLGSPSPKLSVPGSNSLLQADCVPQKSCVRVLTSQDFRM